MQGTGKSYLENFDWRSKRFYKLYITTHPMDSIRLPVVCKLCYKRYSCSRFSNYRTLSDRVRFFLRATLKRGILKGSYIYTVTLLLCLTDVD